MYNGVLSYQIFMQNPMTQNTDLVALQIQCAHLEQNIDQLNAVVYAQSKQIQELQDQLKLLYRHMQARHQDAYIAPFDLLLDRPPHYWV